MSKNTLYYVPANSIWPFLNALALFLWACGLVNVVQDHLLWGGRFLGLGSALLSVSLMVWFYQLFTESQSGLYSAQVNRSLKLGLYWFFVSEIMLFAALLGAFWYVRWQVVGRLGHPNSPTHQWLWPKFLLQWPILSNPNPDIVGPTAALDAFGLPLLNTIILMASSLCLTLAHWALNAKRWHRVVQGLLLTILLAGLFLSLQGWEYWHAYHALQLKLNSGIYASLFYIITALHGLHVLLGMVFLMVVLVLLLRGAFAGSEHFAFEASVWYWHLVDAIWLLVFFTVYSR